MATVAIIGGGAAGYFAAVNLAERRPDIAVVIYEGSAHTLSKVRISGGGRCNVSHDCPDPRQLVRNYPRGEKALLGPFHQFGPQQLRAWFELRGVTLKVEADGRIFPQSDQSQTIIDCFQAAAQAAGVQLQTNTAITSVQKTAGGFIINNEENVDALILATGSSPSGHRLARSLGHQIIEPVPSLFTFKTDAWIHELAGLSVEDAQVTLLGLDQRYQMAGPLLCTHWGVSGPAVLKCSAWAARALHACNYKCSLQINWLPAIDMRDYIEVQRRDHGKRHIINSCPAALPKRLWAALCQCAAIREDNAWSQITKSGIDSLRTWINACELQMNGKTTFKEEFVTAGGVDRDEINWKRMCSKICPQLYFAGECIDVDAVTGGYNFQHAWTSAWLAAADIAQVVQ